jgi:hypothetical protein
MNTPESKLTGRKNSAVSSSNTSRIIHDFGRDFFFDEASQKITAVLDQTLQYDFCEASAIRAALNCGEIDTLEMLWKDKDILFISLLSDDPSRNTHNDEFNFKHYGFTNFRKCGSALYREDKACSTCSSPTHLRTGC